MKKMKKLAGIALALVLALALAVPAFAAGEGSITVTNASKGETYKLVKLFDATYNTDTKTIVYTGNVPEGLGNYFQADTQGYISVKEGATGEDGKLSPDAVSAITAWAQDQKGTEQKAGDNGVTFTGLDYGYYVVVSRVSNGNAVSVTSTMPNATVADKNTTGNDPHFPEDGTGKVVTTASGTNTVAVGETVTYTITYNTVNWIDNDGDPANGAETQVTAYAFKDSLPDFLDNVTVTSITVTDANGRHEISNPPQFTKGYDLPIMVGWADHDYDDDLNDVYTSRYTNGAVINITYTAVVNEKVLEAGDGNHKNEISAWPVISGGNGPVDTTDEDIYTATLIINKFAANPEDESDMSTKLAGAEFVLVRASATGVGETFENTFEYLVIDPVTKAVSWTDDAEEATIITTDDEGSASFAGLASGDYFLYETKAPAGYNLLSDPVEVTLAAAADENVMQTQDIANSTGAVLPSTGGIGTTIFYVGGGILVAAAAILLITKKRMSAAN